MVHLQLEVSSLLTLNFLYWLLHTYSFAWRHFKDLTVDILCLYSYICLYIIPQVHNNDRKALLICSPCGGVTAQAQSGLMRSFGNFARALFSGVQILDCAITCRPFVLSWPLPGQQLLGFKVLNVEVFLWVSWGMWTSLIPKSTLSLTGTVFCYNKMMPFQVLFHILSLT